MALSVNALQKFSDISSVSNEMFSKSLSHIISQMPGFVAWKTVDSVYAATNELCAKLAGYKNVDSYLGTKDYDWKCDAVEIADKIIAQDKLVLETKKQWRSFNVLKFSHSLTYYYSQKSVIYAPNNDILGILFIGTILTDTATLKILNSISQYDPEKSEKKVQHKIYSISDSAHELHLTRRQEECLFYILRGKNAKTIAKILGLSFRTIEVYINELKVKFQCSCKSSLIEKAIELGYFYRVPISLIKNNMIITDDK